MSYTCFSDFLVAWVGDMRVVFPEFDAPLAALLDTPEATIASRIKAVLDVDGAALMKHTLPSGAEPLHFLPGVDFRLLFGMEGVSDATREKLWKYVDIAIIHSMMGDVLWESAAAGAGAGAGAGGAGGFSIDAILGRFVKENVPEEFFTGKLGEIAKEIAGKITPEILGLPPGASEFDMVRAALEKKDELARIMYDIASGVIEDKKRRGEITAAELQRELHALARKLAVMFPKMAGMGFGHAERAAADPRRQAMLDRLRKKQAAKLAKMAAKD